MGIELSPERRCYIGVVHLPPLPGTPFWAQTDWEATIADVADQAMILADSGFGGVLLQSADRVYPTGDDAEPGRVVGMTRYAMVVRERCPTGFAVGVQLLRHGVSASLAVARLTGLDFVRVDALIGATLTTHGWVEPDALSIMRRRRELDADGVTVICDIESSHFHWMTGELPISALARKAVLVGADAVTVDHADVDLHRLAVDEIVASVPQARVFMGGHLTPNSVRERSPGTCGGFVRSCLLDTGGRIDGALARSFTQSSVP